MHEEKPLRPALGYPLYLIANDKGVLVAKTNGKDCILLFHRKEVAERHIAEAKVIGPLYPLAIPSARRLSKGIGNPSGRHYLRNLGRNRRAASIYLHGLG